MAVSKLILLSKLAKIVETFKTEAFSEANSS